VKTIEQIAADCGLDSAHSTMLERILNNNFPASHPLEGSAHDIIGALYRRIEKLEEAADTVSAILLELDSRGLGNSSLSVKDNVIEALGFLSKEGA